MPEYPLYVDEYVIEDPGVPLAEWRTWEEAGITEHSQSVVRVVPEGSEWYSKLRKYHKPYDHRREHTSAWMSMFAGRILPLDMHKQYDEAKEARKEEAVAAKKAGLEPPPK